MNGAQSDGAQTGPYPTKELRLIDMTLKMFTEPRLVLDVPMLSVGNLEALMSCTLKGNK